MFLKILTVTRFTAILICFFSFAGESWAEQDTTRINDYELYFDRNKVIAVKNRKSDIEKQMELLSKDIVSWYDILHRNPEMGYEEKKTASFLSKMLESFGWKVIPGVGNSNSLIAEWSGTRAGNTILIKVNMDALPYTDRSPLSNRADYISDASVYNFGGRSYSLMHGAGNDGHMAIALGLCKYLAQQKKPYEGKIIIVFQSGEYSTTFGRAHGSDVVLYSDYFVDNVPDFVLGFQLDPTIEKGKISFQRGVALPSATLMNLNIYPNENSEIDFVDNTNLLYGAFAQIVAPFQRIVYEERFLLGNPVRVEFNAINGAPFVDVPAQEIEASSMILAYDDAALCRTQDRLSASIFSSAESMGVSAVPSFYPYAPTTVNSEPFYDALTTVGVGNQVDIDASSSLYFSSLGKYQRESKAGGFFFMMGAGSQQDDKHYGRYSIPSDKFFIDKESLSLGLASLYQIIELVQKAVVRPLN